MSKMAEEYKNSGGWRGRKVVTVPLSHRMASGTGLGLPI